MGNPVIRVVYLLVLLDILANDSSCLSFEPKTELAEFNEKIQRSSQPSENDVGIKNFGRTYYPIGYGADPTGKADSFGAIMNAINDAIGAALTGLILLPGVKDLGGIVIDLLGGNYIISQPLRFPVNIGNILLRSGTIRASSTFPDDRHLIELWSPMSTSIQETNGSLTSPPEFGHKKTSESKAETIFYEDIIFRDILFDSSMRGGGLYIADSARIQIDHCFFIHFITRGILVQRGHETYISSSFFGQHLTTGGDEGEKDFSGTAIALHGNDNAITDVTIFSAAIGIEVLGQANMLTGVHCYNKATRFGGVGIWVRVPIVSQIRIDNCLMDYTAIVLEDPVQVHVSNTLFLGDANVVIKSVKGRISGLNIVDNMFAGSLVNPIVKLEGEFTNIDQVVVDGNNVNGGMTLKSTIGRSTISSNGTKWVADFSGTLLFPNKINHVQYSFSLPGKQTGLNPSHAVTSVLNNNVVVESDLSIDNVVVRIMVDQFNLPGEAATVL